MKPIILLLIVLLFIGGCTHYTAVPAGRKEVGALYSVKSNVAWSQANEGETLLWTIDGPLLEALRFVTLKDGDTLFQTTDKDSKLPRFRVHMTPNEVVEFFVASLKSISAGVDTHQLAKGMVVPEGIRAGSINASSLDVQNLRPADFGSLPGFRFDFSFLSKEGLERQGVALGTIHDGKLLLIVYTGTKEYYFGKQKQEVETIFSSVRFPGESDYKPYTSSEVPVSPPPVRKVPVEQPKVAAVPPENKPVVTQRIRLRAEAELNFTDQALQKMIKERNFFNEKLNPGGDFPNDLVDNQDGTVTDKVTGLMWQKAGSTSPMTFDSARKYVQELNSSRYGGYGDWRLPTMEELCSLVERTPNKSEKLIDGVFDPPLETCWSSDENKRYIVMQYRGAFCVNFATGETLAGWAEPFPPHHTASFYQSRCHYHVRAVRTAESEG